MSSPRSTAATDPAARARAALCRPGAAWNAIAATLVVVLLALVLATFRDYGMTVDEPVQNRYGNRLVSWYATRGEDARALWQNNLYFYGGFFELVAQAGRAALPFGVYESRHLVNGLFGILGVVAVWGLASRLAGPLAGLLAAAFLALTPRFYGDWFANPKDLPFASLFALAAWAILAASTRVPRLGWREVAATGLAIGMACGVRVAGCVLFLYAAALWLAVACCTAWPRRPTPGDLGRVLGAWLGALAVGWTTMVVFWPWALMRPLRAPFLAFQKLSHFWEDVTIRFDGRLLLSRDLPPDYVPRLLALTLPEGYLVAAVLALIGCAILLRRRAVSRAGVVRGAWLLALPVGPVAWMVLRHTPLYNGVRHVLFVLPPLAALAGAGAAAFFAARPPRLARVLAAAALLASALLTARDMIELHPYQYVYFNRVFAGGLASATHRYETDYWCASFKEGLDWLVREYRPQSPGPITVAGSCSDEQLSYYLASPQAARFEPGRWSRPNLLLAGSEDERPLPRQRALHRVERQGASLLDILELQPPAR
ncbi:MAG TPA: glycosyltransferase family 39 protein [Vicinamibacteria bacterium]|nr:glycosyltransferase family 39 protein [Vicinamibacteria bacterium]